MTAQGPQPRSPVKAVLLSVFVLPGAGQWYNGERKKAAVCFVIAALLFGRFLMIVVTSVNQSLNQALNAEDPAAALSQISYQLPPDSSWISTLLGLLWVIAAVDAALTARRLTQKWKEAQADLPSPRPSA